MKLSEQIASTCCGVLADKQVIIDKAVELEQLIEECESIIEYLKQQLMELDNE